MTESDPDAICEATEADDYDPVAVLGGGSHGHELARLLGPDAIVFDDHLPGYRSCMSGARRFPWVVGAFWPEVRISIAEAIYSARRQGSYDVNLPRNCGNFIHPTADVGAADLRTHVYVGPQVIASHGTWIGDFVSLAAGARLGGEVTLERGVVVGAGAIIIHGGITIRAGAFIGAGAVVLDDVPPGAVVAGNPGRIIARDWNYRQMARGRRGRPGVDAPR